MENQLKELIGLALIKEDDKLRRRLEIVIGIIGAVLVTIFLGGFTIVSNQLDNKNYKETFYPIFADTFKGMNESEGIEVLKTLGAWFGVTVFLVLVCVALGSLFINNNRYPKRAGILYLAAGVITLFGSQLVAYPLAFIFFVVSAMCFLRKEPDNVSNKN